MTHFSNSVKYIHILLQDEIKFSFPLVKNINTRNDIFNKEEHMFVTSSKKVYEATKEFSGVVYDESGENLINKYAPKCDWVILHGHLSIAEGIKIKNKYLGKIILRFWGGHIGYQCKNGNPAKNIAKKILNSLYISKVSRFAAFGIANKVDEIVIRKTLKNIPVFEMPYGMGKREEILELLQNEAGSDELNVLVGHNAWDHDNHIDILKKLEKYGDKIKIYLPLSYGNANYKAKVEKYIEENNSGNIVVIRDFMPYNEYVKFLNKMDVAIFDGEISYALGNIAILLLLKKKLFVNRSGVIKATFDVDNVPHMCTDKLDDMDFDAFSRKIEYPKNMNDSVLPYSRRRAIEAWKTFQKEFS